MNTKGWIAVGSLSVATACLFNAGMLVTAGVYLALTAYTGFRARLEC